MQLENVITKLIKFINTRLEALSVTITSGGVDSMENYKYIIGQINGLEATKQELSNLLNDKEQNEGTVIDIKTKQSFNWCKAVQKRRTKITKTNRLETFSFTFQDERKN